MTEKDVDQQIGKEYNAFYTSVYDGIIAAPEDLIERFKKALFYIAPAAHQIYGRKMKELVDKEIKNLTWVEVGVLMNTISEVPFHYLYTNLEEAIDKVMYMEEFKVEYSRVVSELDAKMRKKKEVLMSLGGSNNGASVKMPPRAQA